MADILKARAYAMAGMLMCCLGGAAWAAEAPRLSVQTAGTHSGVLKDGDIITRGHLATRDAHVGFQVWSDTAQPGSAPNRYTITGTRNGGNVLHVRIERDGGYPDTKSGGGLVIGTSDDVTSFNIVVDGEQSVVADNYLLVLNGAAIEPNGSGGASLSEVTTKTVSLEFNAERLLRHELWAVQHVFPTSLADNTLMARGIVTTLDSSEQHMAVRFAQGQGGRQGDVKSIVLPGDNDAGHQLKVKLQFPDHGDVTQRNEWMVNTMARSVLNYTINADGAQKVPVDTYTVKVDAGLWSE